jgi:glycosyltransferase involved in cell wall biosynthesis
MRKEASPVAERAAEALQGSNLDHRAWHIVSPEYPPQLGGVGDYVYLLAHELAHRGDNVHVWCSGPAEPTASPTGVNVHAVLGRLNPADLWRLGRELNRFPKPRNILLQWVPHGFGWRSLNLFFCMWMWARGRLRRDHLEIMVHEPFLAFWEGNLRQTAAAGVHRLMTILLMNAAQRICVSTPRWEKAWKPYALGRAIPFSWLPLPSNVPVANDPAAVAALRARYAPAGQRILGHFGTFGVPITPMLESIVPLLLGSSDRTVLLFIGPKGAEFRDRILRNHMAYAGRIHVTGPIPATDPRLSAHLAACDLMIQPYPDGASSRRTSLLAPLAHGVPIVTTSGPSTESLWKDSKAVAMAPAHDPDKFVIQVQALLADQSALRRAGLAAEILYQERFAIERIASFLQSKRGGGPDPAAAMVL